MKILVVTQYFWPESFVVVNDLIHELARQGHDIHVLTGKPNYPDGQVFPGYAAGGFQQEVCGDNIKVSRVPLRARGSGGGKNMVLNYLSFVINGIRHSRKAVKGEKYDVIFAIALSPITAVIPAMFLKKRLKTPLVVWVQDLWPESLSATGFIKNRHVLGAVGAMVRWIYSACDRILVQSRGFFAPVSRFADPKKLEYFPNSYLEPELAPEVESRIPPDILHVMETNFCVLFAGNIGTAQAVETIVEAARNLTHLPDCKLVLVGSGSMLAWVEKQKMHHKLDNLILAGRYPAREMPHFFRRAQALLVSLKREEIFSYTVPSKIQAYFAAGRPVIAALDGEGAQVVREAGAGVVCGAEDVPGLCGCIEQLYRMDAVQRQELADAGRRYFLEHFEMRKQATELSRLLTAAAEIYDMRH